MSMRRRMTGWVGGVTVLACTLAVTTAEAATPPVWETTVGSAAAGLSGGDDAEQAVSLRFAFPLYGKSYTSVIVSTNGEIHLLPDAAIPCCPDGETLLDADGPVIAPFWGDLSLAEGGGVYVKDFGNRLVVTWFKVRAYDNSNAVYTFQAQLLSDGRVIFSYRGMDTLARLGDDAVTGLSPGDSASLPTERNYSTVPFTTGTAAAVYEEFLFEAEVFDLDGLTRVFTPSGGGWQVSATTTVPVPLSPVTICNSDTPPAGFTCTAWYRDLTQFCPYQTYQNRVKDCRR